MEPPSCFLCTSLRYSSSSWSVSWLKGFGGSGSAGTLGGLTGDWWEKSGLFLNSAAEGGSVRLEERDDQFTGGLSPVKTLART